MQLGQLDELSSLKRWEEAVKSGSWMLPQVIEAFLFDTINLNKLLEFQS